MKNNYKSKGLWIPKEFLVNPELDCANKMLLSEIHSLHKLVKGCIAPNEFFSNLLGMTKSAASKRVTRLKKLGYIHTENKYVEGVCTGRKITPTFKKYSTGNVPKLIEGSSPKNQEIVPEQLNGSSQTTNEVVPEIPDGSSQTTNDVVPEIPDGSSDTNTINTTTNTKELIQDNNTDAGEISELISSDNKEYMRISLINDARKILNNFLKGYPNWESDILKFGADEFIKRSIRYHSNRVDDINLIRMFAELNSN
jgi:hypothetical protein